MECTPGIWNLSKYDPAFEHLSEFAFAELTYCATYTAAIFSELPKSHPVVHCRVFAKHATLILPRSLSAVLPCGNSCQLLRSITSSEDLYHCFDFAWGSGVKIDSRYIHEDKTQRSPYGHVYPPTGVSCLSELG